MSTFTVRCRFHPGQAPANLARFRAAAPMAEVRALNRAIASGKVAMSRAIADDTGMKVRDVQERILVEEAKPASRVARLRASIKRIPLMDFGARGPEPSHGKGRGVSATLKSGGGRTLISPRGAAYGVSGQGRTSSGQFASGGRGRYPRAFIATMKSGHKGVFERTSTKRLGIYELFGPSIVRVFNKHAAIGKARAAEQLVKNLVSEMKYALRKGAR